MPPGKKTGMDVRLDKVLRGDRLKVILRVIFRDYRGKRPMQLFHAVSRLTPSLWQLEDRAVGRSVTAKIGNRLISRGWLIVIGLFQLNSSSILGVDDKLHCDLGRLVNRL